MFPFRNCGKKYCGHAQLLKLTYRPHKLVTGSCDSPAVFSIPLINHQWQRSLFSPFQHTVFFACQICNQLRKPPCHRASENKKNCGPVAQLQNTTWRWHASCQLSHKKMGGGGENEGSCAFFGKFLSWGRAVQGFHNPATIFGGSKKNAKIVPFTSTSPQEIVKMNK